MSGKRSSRCALNGLGLDMDRFRGDYTSDATKERVARVCRMARTSRSSTSPRCSWTARKPSWRMALIQEPLNEALAD